MESVACILCGSNNNHAVLSEKGRFGLNVRNVICKKCGLVYQNPRPSAEALRLEYASSTYHARYKKVELPSTERAKTEYYYCKHYVDFLRRYCDLSRGGTVLDIGCSTGGVLRRMSELGWKTLGIEPSHNYAEFAKIVHGLEVIEGMVEDIQLPKNTFDVIVATQVLEHLRDPIRSLNLLRASLKDNGSLLLSVPNILNPEGSYRDLFHDVHLFMFSPDTLRLILFIAGFDVVDYKCQDGHINMIAKKGTYINNPIMDAFLPADNWKVVRRKLWWYSQFDWLLVPLQKLKKKVLSFSLRQFTKSIITKLPGGDSFLQAIRHLVLRRG